MEQAPWRGGSWYHLQKGNAKVVFCRSFNLESHSSCQGHSAGSCPWCYPDRQQKMHREAYPKVVTFASFGPPAQNRDVCIGGCRSTLSEFTQNSTAERELMQTSNRVRASGEMLLKSNTMAKHQLKCSPSLHSVVKWLTLLAAAKHSSWLWFAGSDRTYRWPTPSQSLELWIPFWMASQWEEQGKRNTKTSDTLQFLLLSICKLLTVLLLLYTALTINLSGVRKTMNDYTHKGVKGLQIKPG